jgi:hypothetical protein
MMEQIVITDVTRMYSGYVCVAGYDSNGRCVRLSTLRIHEQDILDAGHQPILFPGAKVECQLLENLPDPPHTEDFKFDPATLRLAGRVDAKQWQAVLDRSSFTSVSDIFELPISDDHGHYIRDGDGPRSIGTVRPRGIAKASYSAGAEGNWDYRLGFYDFVGVFYRLKITDLTWHAYGDSLRSPEQEPAAIADQLTRLLKTRRVYLRIGLSRKWAKFPGRCYLQINGIHTFPDYLQGKTFADYRP